MADGGVHPLTSCPVSREMCQGQNSLFEAQLQAMHSFVEKQRRLPGGYDILEQVLSGVEEEEEEYLGIGEGGDLDDGERGAAGKKRMRWKGVATPTPETGCEHGDSYCKGLCRSCYQRWRRVVGGRGATGAGGAAADGMVVGGGAGGPSASSSLEDCNLETPGTLSVLSNGLDFDESDLDYYDDDDNHYSEAETRVEDLSSASSRRTSASARTTMVAGGSPNRRKRAKLGVGGGRRGSNGGGKKAQQMCVQCHSKPILCRALCNGCVQKWYKQRRVAKEKGLPPVPCPSIAILGEEYEERVKGKSVAEVSSSLAIIAAATNNTTTTIPTTAEKTLFAVEDSSSSC